MKTPVVYSVLDINRMLKNLFDSIPELFDINIQGEISNFTLHRSGHMYFNIKDEKSSIKCVMFAGDTRSLRFVPKNGTKIVARGNISVYETTGQYQFYVRFMQENGMGDLHVAFEQLKAKLELEGLFSNEFKKKLPEYPKTIGVVTSPTGAAVHDIMTTLKRRFPMVKVIFLPVLVQGDGAPKSIINAINTLNEYENVDVAIVGRGGGSIEDLWAFNDENVARTIFSSQIPIVSAVGHETDFTISDFVADLRAPTPTGGAELVTPHPLSEIIDSIDSYQYQLKRLITNKLSHLKDKQIHIEKTLYLLHPKRQLETFQQNLDFLTIELENKVKNILKEKQNQFFISLAKLEGASPLKIMSRGYSILYKNDDVVKNTSQLSENDIVTLQMADGKSSLQVLSVERGKQNE